MEAIKINNHYKTKIKQSIKDISDESNIFNCTTLTAKHHLRLDNVRTFLERLLLNFPELHAQHYKLKCNKSFCNA